MNIEEEKKKIDHEHNLHIKRIFLDKILSGILVIILGIVANLVIESIKNDFSQQRFLLESRLNALKEMRLSFSSLSEQSLAHALSSPYKNTEDYRESLDRFVQIANQSAMLFPIDFELAVSHHALMHAAIAYGQQEVSPQHYEFLYSTFESFNRLTRKALWEETLERSFEEPEMGIDVNIWNSERLSKGEGSELFNKLWETWQSTN